ncbi:MAG: S9 family peptidase [Acidimicrobiia bacterium]|nr:S9 family peptidase [Acidimicrobiia bacterium]
MGFPISAQMVARSRVVAEPRWSPDGQRLGWVESFAGRADVVVAPCDASAPPVVVTADTGCASVGAYGGGAWCWAGPDHLAVAGADGSLVLVPVDGGPARVLSREGRAAAPAATPDGSRVAFVLETDDACAVMVVSGAGSGAPVRVSHGADYAWDPAWAPDGSLVAWHEWDLTGMSWDASRLVVAQPDASGQVVVAGGGAVSVGQPRFAPDGSSLAFVSDESGWWNVWTTRPDGSDARQVLAEEREHAEPAWGPGQRSFAWSPDATTIAINRNEDGFGRLVLVSKGSGPTAGGAVRERSNGWHHALDWGMPGIACIRSGARTPTAVTVLDPNTEDRRAVARGPVAGFESAGLVEPETVTWESDGAVVHGLLYRPPGVAAPPMLVDIHGGPTGQATVSWSARTHFFVTRGWAVLAPNHRGSTGYGRAYTQAMAEGWGKIDVADTAAGIRAAATQGWCDPARVAVMGGSSGGLTVLLLCAQHGDLVRAGVSLYGVTDLDALAASTHRFESRYLDRIVGLPGKVGDRYHDRSPVAQASDIRVPVLVLQGDADKVVPPEQARLVVDAIRNAGGTVDHHVYEGEGHGFQRPETVADMLDRTDAFLRKWVLA